MSDSEEELRAEIERLREALQTQANAVRQLTTSSARRHELDARDAATLRRRQATPGDVLAALASAREDARCWNARATELETEQEDLFRRVRGVLRVFGVADCDNPIDALESLASDPKRTFVDDPIFDATDGAHPAWWRGHDYVTERWKERVQALEAQLQERTQERDSYQRETEKLSARYFEGATAAIEACRGVKVTMLNLADSGGGSVSCYDAFGEENPYPADIGECEMIAVGACLCVEAIEKLMAQPK